MIRYDGEKITRPTKEVFVQKRKRKKERLDKGSEGTVTDFRSSINYKYPMITTANKGLKTF